MEAQPLHEFFCNLPLVNIPSLSCSDQDHFALVTGTGVCLFQANLRGDHRDLDQHLEKFTISCSKEWQINPLQQHLIQHWNAFTVDVQHRLCLDKSLKPENRSNNPNFHRELRWAHQCVNFAPLFALLSQDHELFIYQQKGVRWVPIMNISQLLFAQLDPLSGIKSIVELTFDEIRALIYSVLIDCVEWTPFNKLTDKINSYECHLITATKSGILHLWRVVYCDGTFSICYCQQLFIKDTTDPIRFMQVYHDFLTISYRNGRLALIRIPGSLGQVDKEITPFLVWSDDDQIEISCLTIFDLDQRDENFAMIGLLFCKGTHTIYAEVEIKKDSTFNKTKETVSQGPYALELDSICRVTVDSFISSSKDGSYVLIKINCKGDIEHDKLSSLGMNNLCPHGLVHSGNRFLFCTASSICAYYDHLLMRDATKVSLFTFLTTNQTIERIRELFIGTNSSLKTTAEKSFSSYLDLFNVMCFYISKGEIRSEDLNFCLQNNQLDTVALDKFQLQIRRFVSMILIVRSKSSTVLLGQEKMLHIQASCEQRLVKLHAQKIVSEHPGPKRRTLTEIQQKSLQQLDQFNKDKQTKLLCPVCLTPMTFDTNILKGFCRNQHQTSRCPFSLLFCETLQNPYECCEFCRNSVFIYPTVWPQSRKLCLFCI